MGKSNFRRRRSKSGDGRRNKSKRRIGRSSSVWLGKVGIWERQEHRCGERAVVRSGERSRHRARSSDRSKIRGSKSSSRSKEKKLHEPW